MRYNNDPYEIKAKFASRCAETGKEIKKGDSCIYYPSAKQVFHHDSKQAYEYRFWLWDITTNREREGEGE